MLVVQKLHTSVLNKAKLSLLTVTLVNQDVFEHPGFSKGEVAHASSPQRGQSVPHLLPLRCPAFFLLRYLVKSYLELLEQFLFVLEEVGGNEPKMSCAVSWTLGLLYF